MAKSTGLSRQFNTRRSVEVRRIAGISALLATVCALSACATGVVPEAGSDATWEGAKPRPMAMSYAPAPRIGSQPLLPPVPEDTNGLAPIKMSALTE